MKAQDVSLGADYRMRFARPGHYRVRAIAWSTIHASFAGGGGITRKLRVELRHEETGHELPGNERPLLHPSELLGPWDDSAARRNQRQADTIAVLRDALASAGVSAHVGAKRSSPTQVIVELSPDDGETLVRLLRPYVEHKEILARYLDDPLPDVGRPSLWRSSSARARRPAGGEPVRRRDPATGGLVLPLSTQTSVHCEHEIQEEVMSPDITIWLTEDDVRAIKVIDHDVWAAPGVVTIQLSDGVKIQLTNGKVKSGDALQTLDVLTDVLGDGWELAARLRNDRRHAGEDQAVTDHETEALLRETEQ